MLAVFLFLLYCRYDKIFGQISFSGLSIHDTIAKLLELGELKEAEKIKSDFKVPDRRYFNDISQLCIHIFIYLIFHKCVF